MGARKWQKQGLEGVKWVMHMGPPPYRPYTSPIQPPYRHVCSQLTEGGYVSKRDIFTFYEEHRWPLLMDIGGGGKI